MRVAASAVPRGRAARNRRSATARPAPSTRAASAIAAPGCCAKWSTWCRIATSAAPSASGSAYRSAWRSSAWSSPRSVSLARASRSISRLRSMPSACSRLAARTVRASARCRCRYRPAARRGRRPAPRPSPPRPRSRRHGASGSRPIRRHCPRTSPPRCAARSARTAASRAASATAQCMRALAFATRRARPQSGADASRRAQRDEHPAAFLAALGEPGVAEDLDMARHARLALPEHLRELADRQLHRAQQREDAQPRRVGKRTEDVERDRSCRIKI